MAPHRSSDHHFTEIFPIVLKSLPPLYAYQIITRGSEAQAKIGRKLADRLKRTFNGHWVFTETVIVSDTLQTSQEIQIAVKEFRIKEKEAFRNLSDLVQIDKWNSTPQAQADFVARGLMSDYGNEFKNVLQPAIDLDEKAVVEREFDIRGWVVQGEPAISISIESRVIFKEDLKTYSSKLKDINEIVGLTVADKVKYENGTVFKGEIAKIEGKLDEDVSRADLIDESKRDASKPIIQAAAKGEYVLVVGYNEYRYVISALRIVLAPKDYKRFGIDAKKAQNITWINPGERSTLVTKIADIAIKQNLIGKPFTSQRANFFYDIPKHYNPNILLGKNTKVEYTGGTKLFSDIGRFGMYQPVPKIGSLDQPLSMGIINASQLDSGQMQLALTEQLKQLGFLRVEYSEVKISGLSRIHFERAINDLRENEQHIILAIIPNSDSSDEDDWGPYYDFKSLMIDLNIPSQVIDQNTLRKSSSLKYSMQNVALGMSSKMGNIPYILANTLDYADFVVGIDIARKKNKKGVGTQNAAAFAVIHQKGGQFALCRVVDTPLEGETVPPKVLRSLFPLNEFQNKKVIIHRDGMFRGNEIEVIREHMAQLGGEAYFVEVIKSGAPRMYYSENGQIKAPALGSTLLISDTEAFLVSSQSSTATPQPLHIRTLPPFTIGKALHSVLTLTLMHYGSVKRPKSPVTIHFSDRIGYLALRGVKPRGGQGNDMYWL